jgi:hypothetical protein
VTREVHGKLWGLVYIPFYPFTDNIDTSGTFRLIRGVPGMTLEGVSAMLCMLTKRSDKPSCVPGVSLLRGRAAGDVGGDMV